MKGEDMKYLLFIVVLVAVLITAGCVQPGPAKKVTSCDEKYRCNDICYQEPGTCCSGKFYPSDNNNITYCCGGKMVPYGQGACCGDTFYTYPPYGTCCGGKFYTTPPFGTCCGGKWYVTGTAGECCPDPGVSIGGDEAIPKYVVLGTEYTSWKNYMQVWIDTDTQHCCAGKVAPGGGEFWAGCGEVACIDLRTQSCCFDDVDNKGVILFKIKPGKESCCAGTPKLQGVDGKMYDCDPSRGTPMYPDPGEIPRNCRANIDGSVSCSPVSYIYTHY